MRAPGIVLALAACVATCAHAQVISNPNQIRWTARNHSPEPDVAAHLAGRPPDRWRATAESIGQPVVLRHTATTTSATRALGTGELTVQASDTGIPHRVFMTRGETHTTEFYRFLPVDSAPVASEPAPDVEVAVDECAAFVTVAWQDAFGQALPVTGAEIQMFPAATPRSFEYLQARVSVPGGSTSGRVLARADGTEWLVVVRATVGTDLQSDRMTFEATAQGELHCGDSVQLFHAVPGGGLSGDWPSMGQPAWTPGRIVGRFDLVGEDEHAIRGTFDTSSSTIVRAHSGPWNNMRHDLITRRPSSGDFELENLVPSEVEDDEPYYVSATSLVRSHRRLALVDVRNVTHVVESGQTLDLGDYFVIEPSSMAGAIRLLAPPAGVGGGGGLLRTVVRFGDPPADDPDGDGVPADTTGVLWSRSRVSSNGVTARSSSGATISSMQNDCLASFEGDASPAGDELRGTYDLPLGGVRGGTVDWREPALHLYLFDTDTPGAPSTYVDSTVGIRPAGPHVRLAEREHADRDLRFCLGELHVAFRATAGTFFEPTLQTSSARPSSFTGVDFEGRSTSYTVTAVASGTPPFQSGAAAEGLVVALLPEGDYVLNPTVVAVNPGGGTSTVELLPVSVRVGCGQVIHASTGFVLSLDPVQGCVPGPTLTLSGRVTGGRDVARIRAEVAGGAVVDACVACGVDPTFDVVVPVAPGLANVTVIAEDGAGDTASVHVRTHVSAEPSASPWVEPLRVRKGGAGLELTWEDLPDAAEVHAGKIASLFFGRTYDHGATDACDEPGGATTLPMPAVDTYFLVRGKCGGFGTSVGRDSFGVERPRPDPPCPGP